MNRIIKFRGKCTESGDWVYGDLIHGAGAKSGNTYILPNTTNLSQIKHRDAVSVTPESVAQFTGFQDWKGKEVYEGQTCLLHTQTWCVVAWSQQAGAWHLKWTKKSEPDKTIHHYKELTATFGDGTTYRCEYIEAYD